MSVESAKQVGVLTGRAIVTLLLVATSLAWFGALFTQSPGAHTWAIGLSVIVAVCFVVSWVIHRGEH